MKRILVRLSDGQGEGLALLKNRYGASYNTLIRLAVAHLIEHRYKIEKDIPFLRELRIEKEKNDSKTKK